MKRREGKGKGGEREKRKKERKIILSLIN